MAPGRGTSRRKGESRRREGEKREEGAENVMGGRWRDGWREPMGPEFQWEEGKRRSWVLLDG